MELKLRYELSILAKVILPQERYFMFLLILLVVGEAPFLAHFFLQCTVKPNLVPKTILLAFLRSTLGLNKTNLLSAHI